MSRSLRPTFSGTRARPAVIRGPPGRPWIRAFAIVAGATLAIASRVDAAQPDASSRARGASRAGVERAALQGDASAPALDRGGAAPSAPPFAPALPLDRGGDSAAAQGWAVVRAFVVIATILTIAGAVLLRGRFRGGASTPGAARAGAGWRRWLAPASSTHVVQVVQSTRLTARASVHVLRWDGREWLVASSDQAFTVIGMRVPEDGSPGAGGEIRAMNASRPARGEPA